jgi:predicted nucleic acid-binding protein
MSGFVLDASVAVAWLFEDEATEATDALLDLLQDEMAFVPTLWYYEVGNVLLQSVKRKRITAEQMEMAWQRLRSLPLSRIEPEEQDAMAITKLALGEGLSFYDAIYLFAAQKEKRSLASLDKALRLAAPKHKVKVLPERTGS